MKSLSYDSSSVGRGEVAVNDMRARIEAGWTFDQLWDRFAFAVAGAGFTYDYACTRLETHSEVDNFDTAYQVA
jgi:hypothetical protein